MSMKLIRIDDDAHARLSAIAKEQKRTLKVVLEILIEDEYSRYYWTSLDSLDASPVGVEATK